MSLALLYSLNLEETGGGDVTAPEETGADVVSPTSLAITFNENIQFGASYVSGSTAGMTLTPTNGGSAITLYTETGYIIDNQLFCDASRSISSTETLTLAFSGAANIIEDLAGNDLAAFSGRPVTVTAGVNTAPTDLLLSNLSVLTTAGLNASVGTFSATDPDAGDTFAYQFVVGTGDTNNADFSISGATLRIDDPATLGAGTYSIRASVRDSAYPTTVERAEAFTITVFEPGAGSGSTFVNFHDFLRFRP